jgi:hypothetical protein
VSLCVLAGGKVIALAITGFTLSWTHSVEKTRWEEDWRITPGGLEIIRARVKGSGAGIDPPPGSILEKGWWSFRPVLGPQAALRLAQSGATMGGWSLCADGSCMTIGAEPGDAVVITACGSK